MRDCGGEDGRNPQPEVEAETDSRGESAGGRGQHALAVRAAQPAPLQARAGGRVASSAEQAADGGLAKLGKRRWQAVQKRHLRALLSVALPKRTTKAVCRASPRTRLKDRPGSQKHCRRLQAPASEQQRRHLPGKPEG